MEKEVKEIIERARLESTTKSDVFVKELLDLFSVTKRFSKVEIENIFRKVKTVVIKDNFQEILTYHFGKDEYTSKEDEVFFKKYAGKKVNVYEWAGDWWICEDDNYVITTDCFNAIGNGW